MWLFVLAAFLLFTIGWVCLLTQRVTIKQIVAIKLMLQGALLGVVIAGAHHNALGLAQSIVVSALIAEAVVFALAFAMIVNVFRHYPEGDVDLLRRLRG